MLPFFFGVIIRILSAVVETGCRLEQERSGVLRTYLMISSQNYPLLPRLDMPQQYDRAPPDEAAK